MKEYLIKPTIEEDRYQTTLNNAIRLLKGGEDVKITMKFRAKEFEHRGQGEEVMMKFAYDLESYGKTKLPPVAGDNELSLIFKPENI